MWVCIEIWLYYCAIKCSVHCTAVHQLKTKPSMLVTSAHLLVLPYIILKSFTAKSYPCLLEEIEMKCNNFYIIFL